MHQSQSNSSIDADFVKTINNKDLFDLVIELDGQEFSVSKSLLLNKVFDRELEFIIKQKVIDQRVALDCSSISDVMKNDDIACHLPWFIVKVYNKKRRVTLNSKGFNHIFSHFLEFCYCDRVLTPLSGCDVQNMQVLCSELGLQASSKVFADMWAVIEQRLEE